MMLSMSRATLRRYSTSARFYNEKLRPTLPECQYNPCTYSGPSYKKIQDIRSKHMPPSIKPVYSEPLLLTEGKMQWLWDDKGRRYLDMFAGIVTVSVGHCHPKVTDALTSQMGKLWHTTTSYMTSPMYEYAEKLAALMPGDLKICFFTNSGSEANDLAMALIREHTKAFDIIALRNCYHGASPYTIGLTANGGWKHGYANGFGIHHTMNPDPYKGVWGGAHCRDSLSQTDRKCACAEGECQASQHYLDQLQDVLDTTVGKNVAGFFAEPIQGVGGSVQYPKGFLKGAYEKIRAKGGLCVADEVQTGFGRLGSHMWGFESHGVMPDVVTMAKGIGNGFPIGAVVTTPEVARSFAVASHLNTFGGNPLSCTVASKVLDVIKEEGIQKNCEVLGAKLITELSKFRDEFEVVGDVRGKGLMLGIELVADKETRAPLDNPTVGRIWNDMKDMGLIVGRGGLNLNVLRVKPPMCINEHDVDFTIAVMKQAFENHAQSI